MYGGRPQVRDHARDLQGHLISRGEDKKQSVAVSEISEADLMEGDVTVAVEWTTVNYKDGLAITGKAPVVRRFPLVPGIDFAGTVTSIGRPRLEGRRQGHTQRLGCRRDPSWRLCGPGACQGRLADPAAGRHDRTRGDGHRDGRLHGDAVGDGAATPHRSAWPRARGRHRRGGRRRLGRDRSSVAARLPCHRLDRPDQPKATICAIWARPKSSTARNCPGRRGRSGKSAGPAASTRSAATRSPMCCP